MKANKTLECKECGTFVHDVAYDASSVTCNECVIDMLREYDTPKVKKLASAQGYPKGWRFMKEFVHADGTVYHRGVEQPDLKGALQPTPIVVKPKKSRSQKAREKDELMAQYTQLKKQLKKATKKTVAKKLESKLKKLQKQINS